MAGSNPDKSFSTSTGWTPGSAMVGGLLGYYQSFRRKNPEFWRSTRSREEQECLRRGLALGEEPMKTAWMVGGVVVALLVFGVIYPCLAPAGQISAAASGYTVLEPIRHGPL